MIWVTTSDFFQVGIVNTSIDFPFSVHGQIGGKWRARTPVIEPIEVGFRLQSETNTLNCTYYLCRRRHFHRLTIIILTIKQIICLYVPVKSANGELWALATWNLYTASLLSEISMSTKSFLTHFQRDLWSFKTLINLKRILDAIFFNCSKISGKLGLNSDDQIFENTKNIYWNSLDTNSRSSCKRNSDEKLKVLVFKRIR